MKGFSGLHLFSAYRDQYQATEHMWNAVYGYPVYKATMSETGIKII